MGLRGGVERFAVAMGFLSVAILDQEAHNTLGLSYWRGNLLEDPLQLPVLDRTSSRIAAGGGGRAKTMGTRR